MSDPATESVDQSDELEGTGRDEPIDEVLAAAPAIGAEIEVDPKARAAKEHADEEPLDDAFGQGAIGAADSEEPALDEDNQSEPAGSAESAEPDYLADLQRVTAEFANFRKQTEKRNQELTARASVRLAEALLPVLDAFDAAALQGVEGVEPLHAQLLGVLGNEGLEVISDVDREFDPNRHEAVMTEEAEAGDDGPVIAEVLRTGYAWKGRVMRPAMVKVRG